MQQCRALEKGSALFSKVNGEIIELNSKLKFDKDSIEDAKKSLMTFYKNVNKKPEFMCIIVGHYEAVIQDKETGIYIIPITSLKP